MGALVVWNGPDPALADGACFICLHLAKQAQFDRNRERIEAAAKLPDNGGPVIVTWPRSLDGMIRRGDYRGIAGEAPQMGIVDGLCWEHLAGAEPAPAPSALARGGPLPPGLIRGQG